MINKTLSIIESSISLKQTILNDSNLINKIVAAVETISEAFKNGNKVLFCGNGGSAADAQHLAAEFSGRFYKDRRSLPAEALHCNTSYLTAVANDYGYEFVYSRIVDGIGSTGDVLVGISTSGNSKNIIKAYEVAKGKGMNIISLTGNNGGGMKANSEILLDIPSTDTPRIQECHILIGHIICELVEEELFKSV
jgi:D-sedoheptulose 7-phosphate isomerase